MATSAVGEIVVWNDTSATEVASLVGSGSVMSDSGVARIGNPAVPPWVSGMYYDAQSGNPLGAWAGGSITALRLYATPVYVPNNVTVSEFGINVTSGVGSALARIAVYAMGSDFKPGAIVWQGASTLDVSGTGEKTFTGLTQQLQGGLWYWFAFCSDSAIQLHKTAGTIGSPLGWISHSNTTKSYSWFKTLGSLTLPDPFGSTTGTIGDAIRVTARIA